MLTHTEKAYWSMRDARDIFVSQMDIGRVGRLIFYEHYMILLCAARADKGEEIHALSGHGGGVWIAIWGQNTRLGISYL